MHERVSILEEGIQILDVLWNKQTTPVVFEGKYFKLNGATLQKTTSTINQKRIPVTIAGKKNKTMEIAAEYADIWESSYITPEQFASLNKRFDRYLSKSMIIMVVIREAKI